VYISSCRSPRDAAATTIYAHGKGWATVLPTDAWDGGLAAAILIGALAGLLPAIRAARLSPPKPSGACDSGLAGRRRFTGRQLRGFGRHGCGSARGAPRMRFRISMPPVAGAMSLRALAAAVTGILLPLAYAERVFLVRIVVEFLLRLASMAG
jgi:hypothetical protein